MQAVPIATGIHSCLSTADLVAHERLGCSLHTECTVQRPLLFPSSQWLLPVTSYCSSVGKCKPHRRIIMFFTLHELEGGSCVVTQPQARSEGPHEEGRLPFIVEARLEGRSQITRFGHSGGVQAAFTALMRCSSEVSLTEGLQTLQRNLPTSWKTPCNLAASNSWPAGRAVDGFHNERKRCARLKETVKNL